MVRSCPHCGVAVTPDVRFCRHCGTPLKVSATFDENQPISPLAQTVPLSGEGLTTSSLGTDEKGTPETGRVRAAELDQLLRRPRFDTSPDGESLHTSVAPDQLYAAPQTAVLVPPATTMAAPAPAPNALPPASSPRRRRAWIWMTGVLLLVVLPCALLAYYFLRPSATEQAQETQPVVNANQTTEPLKDNAGGETGVANTEPQTEETPQPTPKASPSVEASRDARAKQERERETPTPQPLNSPTPVQTTPAIVQATPPPTQTPTPAPLIGSSNGKTTTAQGDNADTFYFQAVNLVNGRDPRTLQRAELVRALQLFLNVKSGPHRGEASQQAERLGKELDRRRRQSQP
jgi:hypothetical protein